MKKLILFSVFMFALPVFSAEFLIMAKRHWSYEENMTIEKQTEYDRMYQIGDIVQVFPDGKLSDYAHAGGKFYVVRVEGLSFEDALKYHEQWNEGILVEETIKTQMKKRRKYNVIMNNLPVNVLNALKKTYVYNTTWEKIKRLVLNKLTEKTE